MATETQLEGTSTSYGMAPSDKGLAMLVEELTLGNQKEKEEDNWDFGTHSEDGKIDEVIDCTDLNSKPNSLFITKSLLTMQRPCYILTCASYVNTKKLQTIMYACCILHNMIIEDEGHAKCEYDQNDVNESIEPLDAAQQDLDRNRKNQIGRLKKESEKIDTGRREY
ncbi:hypothetical protein DM860_014877 [Cuscuta australis]|uniref:Uncharacterized protein n=1 Tax=Cuscuta australis TaxID=267555 RepID=A0A328DLG4_9ASTE|nr:hypothetical protein DM860_014877 [Cuscuta australis]